MATLLLRLAAPLQSWDVRSKFEIRQTEREPSKSGVIGLLACAMGIRQEDQEALEELSRLEFGIRVDQEGQLLWDFHMVHAYKNRQDFHTGENHQHAYITERYYLADAVFLAGVSTDDVGLLDQLEEAVAHPAFPLCLGRRSCPPSLPILLGRRDCSLREALQQEPWQAAEWYRKRFPQGQPPSEALPRFLAFIGKELLVSHNAAFDQQLLLSACRSQGPAPVPQPYAGYPCPRPPQGFQRTQLPFGNAGSSFFHPPIPPPCPTAT